MRPPKQLLWGSPDDATQQGFLFLEHTARLWAGRLQIQAWHTDAIIAWNSHGTGTPYLCLSFHDRGISFSLNNHHWEIGRWTRHV
jgi:hypothetical protein